MDKETLEALWRIVVAGIIAFVGGTIGYVQRFAVDRVARPPWDWWIFTIKALTAAAAGVVTLWLFAGWRVDSNYLYLGYFFAGWGGAETFRILFEGVFRDLIQRAANSTGPKKD